MNTEQRFAVEGAGSATVLFEHWRAGHFTLPDGLIAQGRGYMALRAAAREAAQRYDGLRLQSLAAKHQARLDALISATVTAGRLPADPLAALLALEREAEEAEKAARLLREASERAAVALEGSIIADTIILEHLRPAFDELIEGVRAIAPDLANIDVTSTAAVSAAGPKAASAFLALSAAAARYAAIMGARRALRRAGGPGYADAHDFFSDTAAIPAGQVIPTVGARLRGAGPSEPLSRLIWLAGPDGKPTLATLSEQDDRARRYGRYLAALSESMGGRRSPALQKRIDAAYEAAIA